MLLGFSLRFFLFSFLSVFLAFSTSVFFVLGFFASKFSSSLIKISSLVLGCSSSRQIKPLNCFSSSGNSDGGYVFPSVCLKYLVWIISLFSNVNSISLAISLVIVSNFEANDSRVFELKIPKEIIETWNLNDGTYEIEDVLYGSKKSLKVENGIGKVEIVLEPLESFIFKV